MKRKSNKQRNSARNRKKTKAGGNTDTPSNSPEVSRRDALAKIRNWGLLGVLTAGGGWYLADEVMATMAEQDLSRVGNGKPTVVQIHDPQCSQCRALQSETRRALENIDDDTLQYVVANIRTAEGHAFASANRVGHVTLLLFDGNGKRKNVLTGPRHSSAIEAAFRSHLGRYGKKS